MNPALNLCPCCGAPLKTFCRASGKAEWPDGPIVCQCFNPACKSTRNIEGTGDKTEDAKAMFQGLALKRGLMKKENA